MARLKKDDWGKPSLKRKEIEVPDLGGSVLVRELPASYSAELNQHTSMKSDGREQVTTVDMVTIERLKFAFGVITDEGEPMFTAEEVAVIATNHGRAFKIVLEAIDELSDVTPESVRAAQSRFPDVGAPANGARLGSADAPRSDGPDVPARASA